MSVTPSRTFLNTFNPSTTHKPLTTYWSLPDSCTTGANQYFVAACCWSTYCYPSPDWSRYQYDRKNYYSPGVCPSNFNYAATSVQHGSITLAVCCPPGFEHWDGDPFCSHILVKSDFSGRFSSLMTQPGAPDDGGLGHTIWTQAVSVAWQQSDLSLFSPSAAPSLDLSRLGLAVSPSISSSSSASSSDGASGLSVGAAAGIGVGATVFAIALVTALWYMSRRYKRRMSKQSPAEVPGEIRQHSSHQYYSAPQQLQDQGLSEAPWLNQRSEIDGTNRVELPGDVHEAPLGNRPD